MATTATTQPRPAKSFAQLSAKHQCFIFEYLQDLNATQAYIRAGGAPKTADTAGPALFGKLRYLIEPLIAQKVKKTELSADEVIERLGWLARSDIRKYMTWGPDGRQLVSSDQLTDAEAACIESITVTQGQRGRTINLKLYDKAPALGRLMQYHGLLKRTVTSRGLIVYIGDAPAPQQQHVEMLTAAHAQLPAPKRMGTPQFTDLLAKPNGKGNGQG